MIVIENILTGEITQIQSNQPFTPPWKVKGSATKVRREAMTALYWKTYPFRMCSSCHQKGVYEST